MQLQALKKLSLVRNVRCGFHHALELIRLEVIAAFPSLKRIYFSKLFLK